MLWTIAVILVVLWALGFLVFHVAGGLIHLLLVVAAIVIVVVVVLDDSSSDSDAAAAPTMPPTMRATATSPSLSQSSS